VLILTKVPLHTVGFWRVYSRYAQRCFVPFLLQAERMGVRYLSDGSVQRQSVTWYLVLLRFRANRRRSPLPVALFATAVLRPGTFSVMPFCGDRGGKPIGASSPLQAVDKLTAELHLAHPACTIAEGFLQWKKVT